MRDHALRKYKDRLLERVVRHWPASVHPNQISWVALGVGLLAAWAGWQQAYGWALVLWLANRLLDGLDGAVARLHHKQSDFGGYLDLVLDFVVYLAIPVGLVAAAPTFHHLWALVLLLTSYVLNVLSWSVLSTLLYKRGAVSSATVTAVTMPPGLIEGAETILFYLLFLLWPAGLFPLLLLLALLVYVTVVQRLWWAYRFFSG
ncbi:MAG: CDP-alcohol phosphatidyltransferase family protein [Chloroflexi bacterium]|nr:CDP-alcohol phosphatidyltransferase family protein [Chloroflexota bacterium]